MGYTTEQTALRDQISSRFLICQRNISLYPKEHPRVVASFKSLRDGLIDYQQETGQPFEFESMKGERVEVEEQPRSQSGQSTFRAGPALRHLLKINFIEKITIPSEVTDDEIFELCFLLLEDSPSKLLKKADIDIDPAAWNQVVLSFFEPKDLTDGISSGGSLLERAAGVHLIKGLGSLLEKFSEDIRESVRSAFMRPAFLQKVSTLRTSLKKNLPQMQGDSVRHIDLIGEILHLLVPEVKPEDRKGITENEIFSALMNYAEFIGKNLSLLTNEIQAYRGESPEGLEMRILEKIQVAPGFSDEVNRFLIKKHRLGVFFQTSSGNDSKPEGGQTAPPGSGTEKKDSTGKAGPSDRSFGRPEDKKDEPEVSLEIRFRDVSYDIRSIKEELQGNCLRKNFFQIVLDLLFREKSRRNVQKSWSTVLRSISRLAQDPDFLESAVAGIADLIEETGFYEGEDLLVAILGKIESGEEVLHLLEDVLLPRGGSRQVESFLSHLASRDGRKAVRVLAMMRRQGKEAMRGIALPRLRTLAQNKTFLASWIAEDTESFLHQATLEEVLGNSTPALIHEAFREFFKLAPQGRAEGLLRDLPAGVRKAEQIFFAAMEAGLPSLRVLAMGQLYKAPTPMVISTLIEILNQNNFKERLQMDEVETALKALVRIDDEKAAAFLQEVLQQRNWLGYAYSKEIRKALQTILDKMERIP